MERLHRGSLLSQHRFKNMMTITEGIVIGGAGGAIAGLTVWSVQFVKELIMLKLDSNRVYKWFQQNTVAEPDGRFRSTRAIASWNNLTQDRVRYVCSVDKRIFLSVGNKEDRWSIHKDGPREETISQAFIPT